MRVHEIDGLPVLNATKAVSLTILPNDIGHASRKEPMDCVVARACRRDMHAKEVRVHLGRIYVRTAKGDKNKGSWTRYLTPKSMRTEIIAFDRGGQFEPGTFTLSAPQPSRQKGRHQGGVWHRRSPQAKKRRPPAVVKNVRTGPA